MLRKLAGPSDGPRRRRAHHPAVRESPAIAIRDKQFHSFETIQIGDKEEKGPVIKDMDFWEIEDHQIGAWDAGARFSAIVGMGPRSEVRSSAEDLL